MIMAVNGYGDAYEPEPPTNEAAAVDLAALFAVLNACATGPDIGCGFGWYADSDDPHSDASLWNMRFYEETAVMEDEIDLPLDERSPVYRGFTFCMDGLRSHPDYTEAAGGAHLHVISPTTMYEPPRLEISDIFFRGRPVCLEICMQPPLNAPARYILHPDGTRTERDDREVIQEAIALAEEDYLDDFEDDEL